MVSAEEAQFPRVVFATGIVGVIRHMQFVTRKSRSYARLKIEYPKLTIESLGMQKQLKMDNPATDNGWVMNDFPLDSRIILSDNPTLPVHLYLTDHEGNPKDIAKLEHVRQMCDDNKRLKARIRLIEKEMSNRTQEMDDIIDRFVKWKTRTAPLYDSTKDIKDIIRDLSKVVGMKTV